MQILHRQDDCPTPVNLVQQPQPFKRRAFLDFVAPELSLALRLALRWLKSKNPLGRA
ncbi:hypothetical protein ACQR1I_09945 [Bradyrhizobium sp. HKCCYLS2038]|uniref:hypothetical protein n=1 Tax=unclassified Bradyrhizobium TaxID=2631580 RepID=UPI003EB6F60C